MTRERLIEIACAVLSDDFRLTVSPEVIDTLADAILSEMAGECNAAIEQAAQLAAGEPHQDHYRRWPWWGTGDRSTDSELVIFCDALAAQIRALPRSDAAPAPPATPSVEEVARAICKSRTCEGIACCQWPANQGRLKCPVKQGGYDDAAKEVLALFKERS